MVVVTRVTNVLLFMIMNVLRLLFQTKAKAAVGDLKVPKEKARAKMVAKMVVRDLRDHLAVPVPKVRERVRRVHILLTLSLNVHLGLLVVNVQETKLVCVVPLKATSTCPRKLGNRVVVALLRMRKTVLLARLSWMVNARRVPSVESGM